MFYGYYLGVSKNLYRTILFKTLEDCLNSHYNSDVNDFIIVNNESIVIKDEGEDENNKKGFFASLHWVDYSKYWYWVQYNTWSAFSITENELKIIVGPKFPASYLLPAGTVKLADGSFFSFNLQENTSGKWKIQTFELDKLGVV